MAETEQGFIEIDTPDGVVDFPASMSMPEIEAALQKLYPKDSYAQPQNQTHMQRLYSDYQGRESEINNLRALRESGEITRPEQLYRAAGQGAGAVMDTASAATAMADDALMNVPSRAVSALGSLAGKLPSLGGGTIGEGLPSELAMIANKYGEFAEQNPRTAGVIGATGNILGASPLGRLSPTKSVGSSVLRSGVDRADQSVRDLVQQKMTPKRLAQAQTEGRVKQGNILGKTEIKLSPVEERAASLVKEIPALKSPLIRNDAKKGNVIQQEANNIAQNVHADLGKYDGYKFKESYLSQNLFDKMRSDLIENRKMVKQSGELSKTYDDLILTFQDEVMKQPQTLQGLNEARRNFDAAVKDFGGDLGMEARGAVNKAAKKIRNQANEFVAKHIPDEQVRERLWDASSLYHASENIAEKLSKQAETPFGRAIQKLESNIPLRSEVAKLITLGGVGGGAAYLAGGAFPQLALGAGGVYAGGKLLNSAISRKIIGSVLEKGGNIIDTAGKDALAEYMESLGSEGVN